MSKRLKRRIHEACGLDSLSKEERLKRAYEILNSNELKQALCNQILGTKFKDISSAMRAIVNERTPSREEREELELMEIAPEKLSPEDFLPRQQKSSNGPMYKTLTLEETQALIAASNAPFEVFEFEAKPLNRANYRTYSREEVEQMVRDHYSYENENKDKDGLSRRRQNPGEESGT